MIDSKCKFYRFLVTFMLAGAATPVLAGDRKEMKR